MEIFSTSEYGKEKCHGGRDICEDYLFIISKPESLIFSSELKSERAAEIMTDFLM